MLQKAGVGAPGAADANGVPAAAQHVDDVPATAQRAEGSYTAAQHVDDVPVAAQHAEGAPAAAQRAHSAARNTVERILVAHDAVQPAVAARRAFSVFQ